MLKFRTDCFNISQIRQVRLLHALKIEISLKKKASEWLISQTQQRLECSLNIPIIAKLPILNFSITTWPASMHPLPEYW